MTTLTIRVLEGADGTTKYNYELHGADGDATGPLEQEHVVDVHQAVVDQLCEGIHTVLANALDDPTDHHARLVEYGTALHQQLLPSPPGNVPLLVSRLHESAGSIVVRSTETTVPWELLHDGTEFLGLSHDLGRRKIVGRAPAAGRAIGRVKRALLVGDTLGDLPSARREAEHIAQWLGDHGAECTVLLGKDARLGEVILRLASNRFDLFHFCGHVMTAPHKAYAALLLHDREPLDERALQGLIAPPVVFINGCATSSRAADLCVSFLLRGAKAAVGTVADVAEGSAGRFAEEFYRNLLGGATTGAAVRMARTALTGAADAAWASFLLYGDPDVRIRDGGPPVTSPPPPPGEPTLDAAARAMMDRVYGRAVGVVSSMDLLLGLLELDEIRGQIEAAIDEDRLVIVLEMLHSFLGSLPKDDGDERALPSDTVASVLEKAEARATAEGRTAVTTRDIAAAFVEVGGGNAVQFLDLCGVSLDLLITAEPGTAPTAQGGGLFDGQADGDGLLRSSRLEHSAATAIRAALLLAQNRRERLIGTYRLLRGFGMADSRVLRRSLAKQGEIGERAFQRLATSAYPRRRDFSDRASAALERARDDAPGPLVGEAAILRALLADDKGTAARVLRELGIDVQRLRADLGDEGGTGPH